MANLESAKPQESLENTMKKQDPFYLSISSDMHPMVIKFDKTDPKAIQNFERPLEDNQIPSVEEEKEKFPLNQEALRHSVYAKTFPKMRIQYDKDDPISPHSLFTVNAMESRDNTLKEHTINKNNLDQSENIKPENFQDNFIKKDKIEPLNSIQFINTSVRDLDEGNRHSLKIKESEIENLEDLHKKYANDPAEKEKKSHEETKVKSKTSDDFFSSFKKTDTKERPDSFEEKTYLSKISTLSYLSKLGSIEEAEDYRKKTCVYRLTISGYQKYPIFSTSISEMGKYGVGIELYFILLKYLTILFFFISLFSVAAIIINANDDGLSAGDVRQRWDTWNVSNLNPVSDPSELDSNETKLKKLFALDSIYSSIFIVFLVFFQIFSRKIIDKNKEEHASLADYSIEIKGLPSENLKSEDIHSQFSQFGKICEIYIARKYGGYIDFFQEKTKLLFESEYLKHVNYNKPSYLKKAEEIQKKLEKFNCKIKKFPARPHDSLPAVGVYLVFDSIQSRNDCLETYSKDKGLCKRKKNQKETLKFQNTYPLSVTKAMPPNNIIWENLEISSISRFFRQFASFFIVFTFMVLSIIILYVLKSYQNNIPNNQDCIGVDPTQDLSYAETYYTTTSQKNCYCRGQSVSKLFESSKMANYCFHFIELISETVAVRVFVGLGVVIVNFLINFIIFKSNKFQKYLSRSKEQSSLMKNIFFFTFFNTTILTVAINANFSGLQSDTWLNSYVFNGDYLDFSRKWYVNVGAAIVTTLAVMGFMNTIFNLLIISVLDCIKRIVWKKDTLTQREINSKFAGQDFDIASRNAFVLNMVFSCFIYSGGLPLLNLICFFTLFLLYWTDKVIFLRYSKKPPRYNHLLHSSFVKFLPFAIVLHCGISLYMYGASDIFPSHVDDQGNYQDNTVSDRIKKFSGYVNLLLLLLTLMCFVWYFCYTQVYLRLKKKKIVHASNEESDFNDLLQRLGGYNIVENPDYHDLIIAIENSTYGMGSRVSTTKGNQ